MEVQLKPVTMVTLLLLISANVICGSPWTKRNIDGPPEDFNVPFIEKAAAALLEERFAGDPVLVQTIDRLNSKTYYKQKDETGQTKTILQRDVMDVSRPVVVMYNRQEADTLRNRKKRIYIVLRQTEQNKKAYYVTYAYVRKFLDTDDPAEKLDINGESVRIEWDTWCPRDKNNKQARAFGWSDDFDYSTEVQVETPKGIKDVGGGIKETQVKDLSWGLNIVATATLEVSEFSSSNKGKAGWKEAKEIDATNTMVAGGDISDSSFDFFDDLDDEPGVGRMVEDGANSTAESDGASYFRIKDKPLGGFGNCPAVPQSVEVLNSINDPETAANFYLTALQGQCSKKQYKRILRLFGLGHLTINGDQTLSIPVACPLLKNSKLTKHEARHLAQAFELAMASQVYAAELRNPSENPVAPDGTKIPRLIHSAIRFALHTLELARKIVPAHLILVTRRLLRGLKTVQTKVLKHQEKLKTCGDCSQEEKDENIASIYHLQAIQQFIFVDFADIINGIDPVTAFGKFCDERKDFIAAKTSLYVKN